MILIELVDKVLIFQCVLTLFKLAFYGNRLHNVGLGTCFQTEFAWMVESSCIQHILLLAALIRLVLCGSSLLFCCLNWCFQSNCRNSMFNVLVWSAVFSRASR